MSPFVEGVSESDGVCDSLTQWLYAPRKKIIAATTPNPLQVKRVTSTERE